MEIENLTFWYRIYATSGLFIFLDIVVLRVLEISGLFGMVIYPLLVAVFGEESYFILIFIGLYMMLWPTLLILAFITKSRLNRFAKVGGVEEELERKVGFSKFTWVLIYIFTILVILGFISAFFEG